MRLLGCYGRFDRERVQEQKMIRVERTVELNAPADTVWKTIGGFGSLGEWHPAVMACRLEQKDGRTLRVLTLGDGAQLTEELIESEEPGQRYSYRILSGPLPVADYTATLSVEPRDAGSVVRWVGTFDAKGASGDIAERTIAGVYEAGLSSLEKKLA
jgi:carbon monoxide dehydrogenase subunit G